MEERKIHEIIVFEVNNWSILRRISGIISAMSDSKKRYGQFVKKCPECGVRYAIIKTECTDKNFDRIKNFIEKEYPGVCKFD